MESGGWFLLQIFSVSVHLKDQDDVLFCGRVSDDGSIHPLADYPTSKDDESGNSVKVCGTIEVLDALVATSYAYNRSEKSPESLDNTDAITLIGDPKKCSASNRVEVSVDLKDADQCLEISRGFITFGFSSPQILFSRRLSCVIGGNDGWATVYYSFLEDAVQASIAVKIYNKGECGGALSVFGGVFVRYGSYGDYDCDYEKKHYRCVLFKRLRSDEVSLDGEVILPLLVPMVAVPLDDSIIVDVDLHVMSCGSEVAYVCSSSEGFLPSKTPACKKIVATHIDIELTVTWSKYGQV